MPYSFTRKVRQVDGRRRRRGDDVVRRRLRGGRAASPSRTSPSSPSTSATSIPTTASPTEQLADFHRYRDGAIVGRQTMTQVRLEDRRPHHPAQHRVDGEPRPAHRRRDPRRSGRRCFWINREYLDQALKAQGRGGLGIAGMIWVRAARSESGQRHHAHDRRHVAQQRGGDGVARPRRASSPTSSARCRASSPSSSIVTGLVALCIVFIAANTASMAVRERAGEIAVLKAIGFGRRVIFGTLLAEAMALSIARRRHRVCCSPSGSPRRCRPSPAGTTPSARSATSSSRRR